MRAGHLRIVIFVALLIVIGGWGLLSPSQGQQGSNCPQAGCPEKPKDDPPKDKQWVLVIVHVGKGKVRPPCDPSKNPVADAEVIFQDPKTKNPLVPGSQKPDTGLTDAQGRYAAYLALPEADWEHVEVQVRRFGFKFAGLAGKTKIIAILREPVLYAIACLEDDPQNPGQLELQIWPGPGVPNQNIQPLGGKQKTDVGSWMCANLDNDDRDDIFDLQDNTVAQGGGPGKDENDLVKLVLPGLAGAPANATVQLKANKGANNIKLWDSPTKGNQVNLPATYAMNVLPKTLWIEGVAGSAAPRDVELELVPDRGWGAQAPKSDKVALTVIAVKLEWVGQGNSVKGDNTLDANAHPGPNGTVGKRVFPDAPTSGQPARDKVTLQVTLSAPVPAEFKLYLRSLDVDDPSSNSAELDPNDRGANNPCPGAPNENCYPNTTVRYTLHEDNRGSTVLKSGQFVARDPDVEVPATALTDPQGVQYFPATVIFKAGDKSKSVDFRVTKQPGDNFRVLASCDPDFLKDAINQDNQGHGLDIRIATAQAGAAPLALLQEHSSWTSEVLTVWRRLHIERDSMHNPNQSGVRRNTVTGTITNVQPVPPPPPLPNRCEVAVTQLQRGGAALANLEDVDQYAPGELTVVGLTYKTVAPDPDAEPPIHANTLDTVTVASLATLCPQAKEQFTLHDDDVDKNLPQLPDLGWMQESDDKDKNLFAWAYIRPVDDGAGGTTGEQDFPFDVNTEDDEANRISYYVKRQSVTPANNPNDYWIVYILSVFQGPYEHYDGDPESEDSYMGLSPFFLDRDNNVALIYVEGYQDTCGGLGPGPGRSGLQATVIHEVAHAFGGIENEGGVMNQGCLKPQSFVDVTLNSIRSTQRPGKQLEGGIRHAVVAEME